MRIRIPGWLVPRRRSSTGLIALLLLFPPAAAPRSDLVALLRGRGPVDAELRQAQAFGYYEGLLGTSKLADRPAGPSTAVAVAEVPPPPGWVAFAETGIVQVEPTYLRWRLRPDLDLTWNGTRFRTNRRGYRTPEVATEKPSGTYRVAVFGSSNTMGHGVGDDDPYPRHLERWLNEVAGPGRRAEVVNLAVSADSPTRRLVRLREEGARLGADWILCDATVLDFSIEVMHLQDVVASGVPVPLPFVGDALRRSGIAPDDSITALNRKLRREFEGLLDGAYAGWAAEAKRLGVPLTVAILPRADGKIDSPYLSRLIRSLCRRHGLDYLDLADAFEDLDVEQFRVAPWEKHPSPLGHRAIFESLRETLLDRGGLPGLPLPPA